MSEFKGTKGKWKFIRNKNNFEIETFGISNWIIAKTITNAEQDEANAKLIAYAPEMLEMLQETFKLTDKRQMPTEFEISQLRNKLFRTIKKATD